MAVDEVERLQARVGTLEQERKHLLAVIEILQDIGGSLHFADIVQSVTLRLGETFGLDRCSIFLAERGEGRASGWWRATRTRASETTPWTSTAIPSFGCALQTGETVFIADAATDPSLGPARWALAARKVKTITVIPISWRGAAIGAIFLRTFRDGPSFSAADLEFCQVVANLTAKALRNAHRFERLRQRQWRGRGRSAAARAGAGRPARLHAAAARELPGHRPSTASPPADPAVRRRSSASWGSRRRCSARSQPRGEPAAQPSGRLAARSRSTARTTPTTSSTLRTSRTPSTTGCSASFRSSSASHPELRSPDSPTQRVGAAGRQRARQASPTAARCSRSPTRSLPRSWPSGRSATRASFPRSAAPGYTAEIKIDGAAVSLTYEDGRLTMGATRGNGVIGENITANLRTIADVPLALKGRGLAARCMEVRGEVYMPYAGLQAGQRGARAARASRSSPTRATRPPAASASSIPRSRAGAGSGCSPSRSSRSKGSSSARTHWELLDLLDAWGFPVEPQPAALRDAGRGAGADHRATRS